MTDLQDRRQAMVAAELVAADDRFKAWQRSNKDLADEFRADRVIAAEHEPLALLRSSPEYDDLQRRRAADGFVPRSPTRVSWACRPTRSS